MLKEIKSYGVQETGPQIRQGGTAGIILQMLAPKLKRQYMVSGDIFLYPCTRKITTRTYNCIHF